MNEYKKRMFDSFVFLPLSTRAYFKGRAYIKIILKNHARSYFAGRSYYRGNTVLISLDQAPAKFFETVLSQEKLVVGDLKSIKFF